MDGCLFFFYLVYFLHIFCPAKPAKASQCNRVGGQRSDLYWRQRTQGLEKRQHSIKKTSDMWLEGKPWKREKKHDVSPPHWLNRQLQFASCRKKNGRRATNMKWLFPSGGNIRGCGSLQHSYVMLKTHSFSVALVIFFLCRCCYCWCCGSIYLCSCFVVLISQQNSSCFAKKKKKKRQKWCIFHWLENIFTVQIYSFI